MSLGQEHFGIVSTIITFNLVFVQYLFPLFWFMAEALRSDKDQNH